MEKRAHIFTGFKMEIESGEYLCSTGDSVKELKRILSEIKNLREADSNKGRVHSVDVSSFSLSKVIPIIAESRASLSSASQTNLNYIKVIHPEIHRIKNPEFKEVFKDWLEYGLQDLIDVASQANNIEHVYLFGAYLNNQIDNKINALRASNKSISIITDEAVQKPKLTDSLDIKEFNVRVLNQDLLTIYKNAFNPVNRIISPYSSINPSPSFQRKLVWSLDKKVDLIDSLVRKIPIGALYVNSNIHDLELGEGCGSILWEGKQRMFALDSFIRNEFPVNVGGKEVYFSQMPVAFVRLFRNTNMTMMETRFTKKEEIIEAYITINSKQMKHTDEDFEHAIHMLQDKVKGDFYV